VNGNGNPGTLFPCNVYNVGREIGKTSEKRHHNLVWFAPSCLDKLCEAGAVMRRIPEDSVNFLQFKYVEWPFSPRLPLILDSDKVLATNPIQHH
jgi:hypothetical protein